MSEVIRCDLCSRDIHPVSASDSLMADWPYGDRIEVGAARIRRGYWGRIFGGHRRVEWGAGIDAHPECVAKLFRAAASDHMSIGERSHD